MKKEQLFNTEAMLGEERRRNAELQEKLVRRGARARVRLRTSRVHVDWPRRY